MNDSQWAYLISYRSHITLDCKNRTRRLDVQFLSLLILDNVQCNLACCSERPNTTGSTHPANRICAQRLFYGCKFCQRELVPPTAIRSHLWFQTSKAKANNLSQQCIINTLIRGHGTFAEIASLCSMWLGGSIARVSQPSSAKMSHARRRDHKIFFAPHR